MIEETGTKIETDRGDIEVMTYRGVEFVVAFFGNDSYDYCLHPVEGETALGAFTRPCGGNWGGGCYDTHDHALEDAREAIVDRILDQSKKHAYEMGRIAEYQGISNMERKCGALAEMVAASIVEEGE